MRLQQQEQEQLQLSYYMNDSLTSADTGQSSCDVGESLDVSE